MRPICLDAIIVTKAPVLSLCVVVRETSPNNTAPAPAPIPKMVSLCYDYDQFSYKI